MRLKRHSKTTVAGNIKIKDMRKKEVAQRRPAGRQEGTDLQKYMSGTKSRCGYHCYIRENSETT
jgi:hypothetical protein